MVKSPETVTCSFHLLDDEDEASVGPLEAPV